MCDALRYKCYPSKNVQDKLLDYETLINIHDCVIENEGRVAQVNGLRIEYMYTHLRVFVFIIRIVKVIILYDPSKLA